MLRIRFTVADLAKTTVAADVDPVVEALFAVELLNRNGGGIQFHAWRDHASRSVDQRGRAFVNVARNVRPVPDMLAMLDYFAAEAGGSDRLERLRRRNVFGSLESFVKAVVEPFWPRICAHIDADVGARGRMISGGGIELLLETLQPNARWSDSVLSVPRQHDDEIRLGGRGLVLVPSLFLFDRPCTVLDVGGDDRPLRLAFPVPIDTVAAVSMWATTLTSDASLDALVGRTRAAIIRNLTEECSTTELGRRNGISAAAASQHATVLRGAGLITTNRWLNTALHKLTPLGSALLVGYDLPRAALVGAANAH